MDKKQPSTVQAYKFWNERNKDPAYYEEFLKIWFQDINPGLIRPSDTPVELPNFPVVVYVCSKTPFKVELEDAGFVSFDRSEAAALNPDGKLKRKEIQNLYNKDKHARGKVKFQHASDFSNSISKNKVTIVKTSARLSPFTLPFISQKYINIVTGPEEIFAKTKYSMSGNWAAKGPMLFVPREELQDIVNHVLSIRTLKFNPPTVEHPSQLVALFNYWIDDGLKGAMEALYDISVNIVGNYYNFSYKDGAPYDDPFNSGYPSPATFCRGITFYYNDGDWKLVRLPMNRGKEISFGDDANMPSVYYSKLIDRCKHDVHRFTAKVDGSLLIVFRDEHNVSTDERLVNSYNINYGTKGTILMNTDLVEYFERAVRASGHTVESFSKLCSDYLDKYNLSSLSFEMVASKRQETVVDYPKEHRGIYFLGASSGYEFKPYFAFDCYPILPPTEINLRLREAKHMPLGPFDTHPEGSVIWIENSGMYFPLKLKTTMYYIMHKKRGHPDNYDYLLRLIAEYGWIGEVIPNRDTLNKQKLILSLFALVDFPEVIINAFPILRTSRELYCKLMADPDMKFKSSYMNGKYSKAYELWK